MGQPKDELLWRDDAGDSLYAAEPRGSHGTLVFIRPGEGEMYLPTAAVDALRAVLAEHKANPAPMLRRTPRVSAAPANYLAEAELTEARNLYERLCTRIRTNVGGRLRHHPAGAAVDHLHDVRRQVTASRRSGTASDADVGELHREWTNIARLASQETTAGPELTHRLAALAAQMVAAYDAAVRGAR